MGGSVLRMLLYAFGAAALVLIAIVVSLVLTRRRRLKKVAVEARGAAPVAPDLEDESSHAGQLTADGWLELARFQMGRGEWRLALRALYLATLARLAAEGLLSLAKFKTNLDYEREAGRRAMGRGEIVARFAARRAAFEAVWYGRTEPSEAGARGGRGAGRRAMGRGEIVARFAARRAAFEAVWYGRTEPSESGARDWLVEMERTSPQ